MVFGYYMSNKQSNMLNSNCQKKEYLFEIKEELTSDFDNTPINNYYIMVLLNIC